MSDRIVCVNPAQGDALIDVDVDSAFMRAHVWNGKSIVAGGLPVLGAAEVIPAIIDRVHLVFPQERRYRSIDSHRRGSVSWYTSFVGYEPMSLLTLEEVRQWTASDNRIAPHALFTLDQLLDYMEQVKVQMLWNEHAGEGTQEGSLHPAFSFRLYHNVLVKGLSDPCCDSYSALRDNRGRPTGLGERMRKDGVKRLFVDGIALDFCVGYTALNAIREYEFDEVFVILDAVASVDLPATDTTSGSVARMMLELTAAGVQFVTSDQLRLVTKPF